MIGMMKLTLTGGILDAAGNGRTIFVRPDFAAIAPHGNGAMLWLGGEPVAVRESLEEIELRRMAFMAPKSGRCMNCGCTETTACQTDDGPCHWMNPEQTLCSNPDCIRAMMEVTE